jgi:hypothetical protein
MDGWMDYIAVYYLYAEYVKNNCYFTFFLLISDIDECLTVKHNCSNVTTCINTEGSFKCECIHGYQGNGSNCTGS